MDCSRCGGELETYSLGEKEACVCLDCGFVDTPVEHEATKRPEPEPWTKALERFHERYAEGDVAVVGSGETAALLKMDDDPDPETTDSPSDSESDQRGDDADTTDSEAGDADSENETTDEGDGESVTEDGTDEDVDGETASDEDVDGETASDTVEEREKPA